LTRWLRPLIPKAVTVDNRRQLRIAGEVAIWTSVNRVLALTFTNDLDSSVHLFPYPNLT